MKNDEVAGPLCRADDGDAEAVVMWTHPATGIRCKGRVDYASESTRRLIDLKTARSAHPRRFGMQAADLMYHCQIVWYGDGVNHWRVEQGLAPVDWRHTLVAVEIEPPHQVGVFSLTEDQVAIARERIEQIMARIAECERLGKWPGRLTAEQALELPRWEYNDDMEAGDVEVEVTEIEEAA